MLLTLACLALAACAAAATAAPLTLQVVNGRGVGQASIVERSSAACGGGVCERRATSGHGGLVLDVAPGDRIAVSRGQGAPEGAGVAYTVPAVVPIGAVAVTLPALPQASSPALDATEGWLLGRVNAERAALGRGALGQSGSLNRAADAYARYLLANGLFDHFALASPGVRAVDQGWPRPGGAGVGEVLALAPSRETALGAWRGSPPHWDLLMKPDATVVGTARAGDRWVMMPSTCAPTDAPERCEIGAGGSLTAPSPGAGGPGSERKPGLRTGERRARLRVRLRRNGRRLTVRVRLLEGRGRLRVAVRQGGRRAHLRARRRGPLLRATTRLPRRGRWKVTVRFTGAQGWADRRLPARWVRAR
jgi:uncharacterized protein YkwD